MLDRTIRPAGLPLWLRLLILGGAAFLAAPPEPSPGTAAPEPLAAAPAGREPGPPPLRLAPAGVAYYEQVAAGVPVRVVQADMNSANLRVSVATASGGIGHREGWREILERTRPTAAITGTYFSLESSVPVGSIVVRGRPVHWGGVGTGLFFRSPGQGRILATPPGEGFDWRGYETVLRAGPRLLTAGEARIAPRAEGFRDPAIWARRPRALVGITAHNKLLLATTAQPATLEEAAAAMRALGAVDALCMDGGSSAGLYYRGETRHAPRRLLTNLLVIYDEAEAYQQRAPRLTPDLKPLLLAEIPGRT